MVTELRSNFSTGCVGKGKMKHMRAGNLVRHSLGCQRVLEAAMPQWNHEREEGKSQGQGREAASIPGN